MNNELKQSRDKIDKLDKKIMSNLDERFKVSEQINKIKIENNIDVVDPARENEIIQKIDAYSNRTEIKNVYKQILTESKKLQAKYVLIGKDLRHTYSLFIHNFFNNYSYGLREHETYETIPNDLLSIGMNITNPYKKTLIRLCSKLTKEAHETGVINVITNTDGQLYGENFDVKAFINQMNFYNIPVENSDCVVLGNGCTSKSIIYALKLMKANSIVSIVRTKREKDEITFDEIPYNIKADIIINTTSNEVYPNFKVDSLIDFDQFLKVKYFIDVNYNPLRSKLFLEASKKDIKCYNGLYMLVENGRLSESLWQKKLYDIGYSKEITRRLILNNVNIILIGQTLAGKTTIGKDLSLLLNKEYIDLDRQIEKRVVLLGDENIKTFRKIEVEECMAQSTVINKVIPLGAGAILNQDNIDILKRNGIIVFIDAKLEKLIERMDNNSRPLLKTNEQLEKMYNQRQQLYIDNCDIRICGLDKLSSFEASQLIREKIYEYIDNQWLQS